MTIYANTICSGFGRKPDRHGSKVFPVTNHGWRSMLEARRLARGLSVRIAVCLGI